jgi:Rieske Fe-S protein
MQVALCIDDGNMKVLNTQQSTFIAGQKIVIERGTMYEIEDVQYQFRETPTGLIHICTNLLVKDEEA